MKVPKTIPADIKFTRTDGGRKLNPQHSTEKNDCSVRAIAIAYNVGYPQAHMELANVGRKYRKGVSTSQYQSLIDKLGHKYTEKLSPRKTLKRVIRENVSGRYILRCRGHVMALVDGVIHDSAFIGANVRITHIWRIS